MKHTEYTTIYHGDLAYMHIVHDRVTNETWVFYDGETGNQFRSNLAQRTGHKVTIDQQCIEDLQ